MLVNDGDDAIVLLEEDRPLSLEIAQLGESAIVGALETPAVAGQALEPQRGLIVRVKLGRGEEPGLREADAAEVPGGGEEAAEELVLESAFGACIADELAAESLELRTLVIGDEEGGGGKAVGARVLSGPDLAFQSAGTGGLEGVGPISQDLSGGSHV
jgi:hypothetical protein